MAEVPFGRSDAATLMQPKLLVIDDDADTRDALSATLTQRGFEVACAKTGAAAIEQLERSAFDAVISDLNMPGMSGIDLCRRMEQSWPALPVVLVTGFRNPAMTTAAMRAGACDVLSKPIQIDGLLRTLARVLDHQPVRDDEVPPDTTSYS